jgi:hypothetical protein
MGIPPSLAALGKTWYLYYLDSALEKVNPHVAKANFNLQGALYTKVTIVLLV